MNAARRLIRFALPLLCALCAVAAAACLCFIFEVLLVNGVSSVDWVLLTSEIREGEAAGGIAYQILGTLLLVAMSSSASDISAASPATKPPPSPKKPCAKPPSGSKSKTA